MNRQQEQNDADIRQQVSRVTQIVHEGWKNYPAAPQPPVPSQTLQFATGKVVNRTPS